MAYAPSFPSKVITVGKVAVMDKQIIIHDQDGIKYSFFKIKTDGTQSKAYESFQSLQIEQDSIVEVSYKVNGQFNNVMNFNPASQQAKQYAQPFLDTGKVEKIVAQKEVDREAGMRLGNAKSCAAQLVAAAIQAGIYKDMTAAVLEWKVLTRTIESLE
jgi:hypothetical protein